MSAVRSRWPNVLVQFEDFSNANAYPLLHKYRRQHLCFNDDIQGTGAVALAGETTKVAFSIDIFSSPGLYSALRAVGLETKDLKHQRIVCVGSGSAGMGVCMSILNGMRAQGMSELEASRNFWITDINGLLTTKRKELSNAQVCSE